MATATALQRITLDDLAAELLPTQLIAAIGETTLERWKRQALNDPREHAQPPAVPPPSQRILPVMVLGEMVIMPAPTPEPMVLQIEEGKSYQAMQAALRGDHEVLLIFVTEAAIAGFKSDAPQPLPNVGVIARVAELGTEAGARQAIELQGLLQHPRALDQRAVPGATHRIQLAGLMQATIVASLTHRPFYRVACVPQPDPLMGGVEVDMLMQAVKAAVAAVIQQDRPEAAPELTAFVNAIDQPGRLADICAYGPLFSFADRLDLLQTRDPVERLRKVHRRLGS